MSFPLPWEIRTPHDTTLALWWDHGCFAEVEIGEAHRYLAHEIGPEEAREMAAWLLAYADHADGEAAREMRALDPPP